MLEAFHPIGAASSLEAGRAIAVKVAGEDLVAWRSADGIAQVWRNRCPHRGMRLSHGFVRGERLICAYHGWQYGTSGQCGHIPAHPELEPPQSIRVPGYPLVEALGFLWTSVDPQASEEALQSHLEPLEGAWAAAPCHSLTLFTTEQRLATALRAPLFPPAALRSGSAAPDVWRPDAASENGDGRYGAVWVRGVGPDRESVEVTYRRELLTPRLVAVSCEGRFDREVLLIGIQQRDQGQYELHAAISSGADDAAARRQFVRWLRRLWHFLENPQLDTRDYRPWIAGN